MKKYITTIIKYAFSILLALITLKTTKDPKFVLAGLIELLAIFTLSDFLVMKSKWFNILNDILMFIFNGEMIMLLFGNSFVTLVMLQSLTSVEDLQGKVFIYGIGTILVIVASFLPITHVEKLKHYPIIAFPLLLIVDGVILFGAQQSYTPYAGAKDLYVQWHDYNEMKRMVEQYKNDALLAAVDEGIDEDIYSDVTADVAGEADAVTDDSSLVVASTGASSSEEGAIGSDATSEDSEGAQADVENQTSVDNTQATDTTQSTENVDGAGSNDTTDTTEATDTTQTTQVTQTTNTKSVIGQIDSKLQKDYPVGSAISHSTLPANTNVIVIFVEGLSNNVITDSRQIMPNLQAFKNECISFTNYYNHTFATYRGIQGQLYSGYSLDDFETNSLTSMMDVMKAHGYNTVFINAEPYNKEFSSYLKAMKFDKVVTNEKEVGESVANCLSDRQAYDLLFDTAKSYSTKGAPFFLGVYSFGTHVSFDSDENVYGDGSNNFMNRYHNCDYQLGAFIENFKKSSLASNTMLIITADHSAYADEDFVKSFPGYTRVHPACDQIPLYIYYNGISTSINAGGRNSLDMAPTVLDLLGFERPSTFVGHSLYSAKNQNTVLDSFFWNPDGVVYTGNGISYPNKKMKEYVNGEVIKYISIK